MTAAFVLAHLSDPHLGPMPQPRGIELVGKRAIGYINWKRKRHLIHRRDVLAHMVADLHAQRPDHIAVTGDLVNIALPLEFTEALAWLESVGPADDVSLVPGNHDAYARSTRHHSANVWGAYMRGDDPGNPAMFPYVRRRGPLALIGLSTAVPTAPFMATGLLGPAQRDALEQILIQIQNEDLCRVILIHHPLVTTSGRWTARLRDSSDVIGLLKRYGVELVLHGHDHRHATAWIDGPHGPIPTIGIPSASAVAGGHNQPAAYQLLSVTRVDQGWRIARRVRGFANSTSPNAIVDLIDEVLT